MDLDNFIDYHLAVIYFQNFDIGNIKCWRPRITNGRFRWIVYDQDYGFNLWIWVIYIPAMARDYGDYDNMFRVLVTRPEPERGPVGRSTRAAAPCCCGDCC